MVIINSISVTIIHHNRHLFSLLIVRPDPACTGLWTSALQPLLAWAEDVVPRKQWEDTPLFLFGTAGLRVLTPESQSILLSNIQNALRGAPFRSVHPS